MALTGCTESKAPGDLLLGTWAVGGASDVPACVADPPVTEYRDDGTAVTTNGAQRSVTQYALEPEGEGFMFSQALVSHNGQPSCAGNPASFLEEVEFPTVYVEIDGDRLTTYVDGPGSESFDMVRVRESG